MRPILLALLLAASAPAPASAQSLRAAGSVLLRSGPGLEYPATGALQPGERVERGPCDEQGRWCIVSTDALYGWVDTGGGQGVYRGELGDGRGIGDGRGNGNGNGRGRPDVGPRPGPRGVGVARGRPAAPLAPPPPVATMPLPRTRYVPLPPRILAAVPPPDRTPPGARPPLLLSTTVPVRNVTDGLVNLRAGPGTDAPVVGLLRPGEGGRIDLCDAVERWCRIAPQGMPPGWVRTTLIGLRRM